MIVRMFKRGLAATIVALAGAMLASGGAQAGCSLAPVSNLNFGSVDLTDNTAIDVNATLAASCSGETAGATIQMCIHLGPGSGGANGSNAPRYMKYVGNELGYNIFTNPPRSSVWGSTAGGGDPVQVLMQLDGNGDGTQNVTMYGRIYAGQQTLATGSYQSAFTDPDDAWMAWDVYTGGNCASLGTTHQTVFTFSASASYPSTCTATGGSMNFGQMTRIDNPVDSMGSISTTCSASTPYSVSFGDGLHASGSMQRRMGSGANRLSYDLYQDTGRSSPWGSGVYAVEATGTGLPQSRTVYGRIPPQVAPPPGSYNDTVVVTVSY